MSTKISTTICVLWSFLLLRLVIFLMFSAVSQNFQTNKLLHLEEEQLSLLFRGFLQQIFKIFDKKVMEEVLKELLNRFQRIALEQCLNILLLICEVTLEDILETIFLKEFTMQFEVLYAGLKSWGMSAGMRKVSQGNSQRHLFKNSVNTPLRSFWMNPTKKF